MAENILEKIIKKKIERIDLLKKSISLNSLIEKIDENVNDKTKTNHAHAKQTHIKFQPRYNITLMHRSTRSANPLVPLRTTPTYQSGPCYSIVN